MNWYSRNEVPILHLVFVFMVFCAGGFFGRAALAQEIETFPLDEPITDTAFTCLDKGAAMELFSAFRDFEGAPAEKKKLELANMQFELFRMRATNKCGMVSDTFTYRALLESYKAKDGMYYTLYEADVGESENERTAYVLLVNWKHFRVEA